MTAELQFNLGDINAARDKYTTIIDTLTENRTALKENLDGLQGDWQTAAGRAFQRKIDDKWYVDVQNVIDYITVLKDALDKTIEYYKPIEEEYTKVVTQLENDLG